MAEPVTGSVVAGTMLTTGSILADLVIFTDSSFVMLAIVGAIVSSFGVTHELLSNRPLKLTIAQLIAEFIKGIILGVLAIPFWYIALSATGESILASYYNIAVSKHINSVWLMISFGLSWYTVPIFDWLVSKIKRKASNV